MTTISQNQNHVRAKRRLQQKQTLEKLKDVLMRQFIARVKAGEPSAEVLADVNRRWCIACDNAKAHPATKEHLVMELDKLIETIEQVQARHNREKWAGRILLAIIMVGISAGTYAAIQIITQYIKN